jgi:hypothetical protein
VLVFVGELDRSTRLDDQDLRTELKVLHLHLGFLALHHGGACRELTAFAAPRAGRSRRRTLGRSSLLPSKEGRGDLVARHRRGAGPLGNSHVPTSLASMCNTAQSVTVALAVSMATIRPALVLSEKGEGLSARAALAWETVLHRGRGFCYAGFSFSVAGNPRQAFRARGGRNPPWTPTKA